MIIFKKKKMMQNLILLYEKQRSTYYLADTILSNEQLWIIRRVIQIQRFYENIYDVRLLGRKCSLTQQHIQGSLT